MGRESLGIGYKLHGGVNMHMGKPQQRARVLLVEDDEDLLKINSIHLSKCGYEIITANTLKRAYEAVVKRSPHIIVLDVDMPDGSGVSFCCEIRKITTVPIIFLTCFDQEKDKVTALISGGDDYLTKPYSLAELAARVYALLRRATIDTVNKNVEAVIDLPPLRIDTVAQRVYLHEKDVLLSTKEYQLLLMLVKHAGKTISAPHLYEKVWGLPLVRGQKTLQVHISTIRKKLNVDDTSDIRIQTIRNAGYRFEHENRS